MSGIAYLNSVDPVTGLPVKQFSFLGNGGVRLAATRWEPVATPPAIVCFAHGFTAYMGAYANVLRTIVDAGFLVYALDHRGHGYSEGKRASLDRLDDMVDDFERLVAIAREENPGRPVFTLGHSMGGLIAARHALRFQEGLAGVIPVSAAFTVGENIAESTARLLILASNLAPEFPAIGDSQIATDSVPQSAQVRSRDILAYQGKVRLNMARELYLGGQDTLERASEWRLPILLQHGSADTVTMPSGSEQAFARSSSSDRTLELWPGRPHNLITDDDWQEPVGSIVNWLRDPIAPARRIAHGRDTPVRKRFVTDDFGGKRIPGKVSAGNQISAWSWQIIQQISGHF